MEQQLAFFLALAAGLIFGGLAVWLMLRADTHNAYARAKAEMEAEHRALTERLSGKEARIAELTRDRDELKAELEEQRKQNAGLEAAKAELEVRLAHNEQAAQDKLALLDEAREKFSEAFKALSADALKSNNQAFLDLAKTSLEKLQADAHGDLESRQKAIAELLKPLRDSLGQVDANLRELEKTRAADYAGLSEQVNALRRMQEVLRTETSNLVNALRTPSVRGRWGEIQLRRVVEMAGMSPHCDFDEQANVETENGRQRPDMVIHLPNQRQVVVDAKVSLKAYLEALDATGEETRTAKLREHASQVKAHLQRLGGKTYWEQFSPAPEFVVAFLPGEAFFSAALEQDPGLIEYGAQHRVILATPTTLIALLKAVAYGWQQEKLAQSAQEISNLGRSLYGRLRTFTGYLEEIRKNLQRSVDSYNRAAGSFESRVLVSARRFTELGAAPKGEIPAPQPVDKFPRSLRAIEGAVTDSDTPAPELPAAVGQEDAAPAPGPAPAAQETPGPDRTAEQSPAAAGPGGQTSSLAPEAATAAELVAEGSSASPPAKTPAQESAQPPAVTGNASPPAIDYPSFVKTS